MALNSDKIIGATILAAIPGIVAMSLVWGMGILQNILLKGILGSLGKIFGVLELSRASLKCFWVSWEPLRTPSQRFWVPF